MNLLNIKGIDIEMVIQESISETKEKLQGLDYFQTCKIYSSVLFDILKYKNVLVHIINTKDFGPFYEHQFLLVYDGNNYFLIDLNYAQFQDEHLNNLSEKGYTVISQSSFDYYLKVITKSDLHLNLDNVFISRIK